MMESSQYMELMVERRRVPAQLVMIMGVQYSKEALVFSGVLIQNQQLNQNSQ